jgi:hypothetical protein
MIFPILPPDPLDGHKSILPEDVPPKPEKMEDPNRARPPLDEVTLWTQVLRIATHLKTAVWSRPKGPK